MPKSKIRVIVRTRPTSSFAATSLTITQNSILVNTAPKRSEENASAASQNQESLYKFQFDRVLHNASQDTVYEEARETVQNVINGTNSTILTYGQTGSGKTFTMTGDTRNFSHRGIAPRAITHVFSVIDVRDDEIDFKVSCVYYEIYNEKVYDLLDDLSNPSNRTDFQIAEEKNGRGTFVRGLNEVEVSTEQEALNLLYSGELSRTTSQHKLNRKSNRSHSIFTLFIQQRAKSGVSDKIVCSKLNLVDLAGSERLKKTLDDSNGSYKIDETTKKESMYINQSLTYLEQCVVALSKKNIGHVPYRQTKLTSVLKDAIGGNCTTLMFANMWGEQAHLEETISTLRLATRMMRVTNDSTVNETFDEALKIKKLEKEVKELKMELLMHDAMAERSGVVYDAYTPEQKVVIRESVQAFIEAGNGSVEEDEAIDLSSLRMMREVCVQFKGIVSEKNTIVKKAKEMIMVSNSRLNTPGAAIGGESKIDENNENGLASGNGNADFGEEKDAVGEYVTGDGFGFGTAGSSARPSRIDGFGDSRDRSRGRDESGSLSPERAPVTASNSSPSPEKKKEGRNKPARANIDDGFSQTKGEVPLDKEEAFALYKRTKGRDQSELSNSLKAEIKGLKNDAKVLVREANEYKEDIDRYTEMLSLKKEARVLNMRPNLDSDEDGDANNGVDVVDQEEFDIMKDQRDAKRGYKVTMVDLNEIKRRMATLQGTMDETKFEMLTAFDLWHGLAVGTIISNDNAEGEEGRGEVMDDAELFERMELERVTKDDPESVAFFQAQKTRRANQTQNSLSITQMRRNKRSVGA